MLLISFCKCYIWLKVNKTQEELGGGWTASHKIEKIVKTEERRNVLLIHPKILLTCNFCQQLLHIPSRTHSTVNSTQLTIERRLNQKKTSLTTLCCWRTQSNFLCPLAEVRAFVIKKGQKITEIGSAFELSWYNQYNR